ncbi:hypothetical protein GBAR_LOCUS10588 [Geodia barretti]|uniref:SAM domain-containing protein n=1 Tax=Geodia barretti TaxID=519541 RepID=A0AA35RTJ1_GEOBA|nr:hypothetical protein GBAR_LOCUS10588 [Geodia barretti]
MTSPLHHKTLCRACSQGLGLLNTWSFQSNEIDLEALLLMSDKDFSEIGLPQAAQTTLMNSLGRRTPSAVREEGVASSAADQGDGRGFPSGSRQQEDSL